MPTRIALIDLDQIRAAQPRVATLAYRTPAIEIPSRPSLVLKCENMQPAGAFKIRGAANMLQQLSGDALRRGVITYSSGNHGQAVALAARALASAATIVMPTTAAPIKVAGVRSFGAEVIFEGTSSSERRARAEREAGARGLTIIPPYDHEHIIAGQGTAGLEILEQVPDVALVLVPIGGGGLASGIAAAIKLSQRDVRVVGVEPEGANAMQQSLEQGKPVTIADSNSIADGLLPVRPGDSTFAHVEAFVDEVVTVSDQAIIAAMRWLYYEARIVVEPSGATALAALLSGVVVMPVDHGRQRRVVAVLSGGNIAPQALAALFDDPSGVSAAR